MPSVTPIPLTGTGGLFSRIGAYGGLLNAINASRGTTIPAHALSVNNQYLSTDQDIIDNLYSNLLSYQNSCSSFNGPMKSQCQNTIIQMANESLLLSNSNLNTALILLVSQMKQAGQTVNQCTVNASANYSIGNVGNPVVVLSVKDINNTLCEYSFSELCTGNVTNDYQSNSNLAGVEPLTIVGQQTVSDTFSYLYPKGSACSISLNAVSGLTNGSGGVSNWLVNGSFETWSPTANGIPTSWNVGTGTPGTTIIQSSSPIYDGLYSLQFAGNGSELTSVYQKFSTSLVQNNTPSIINPNSIFAFNCFIRTAGSPASGVLRVSLFDGTNPILDNSGTANSVSVNLNSVTTTWVPLSISFRTPNQIPTSVWLQIALTTALPSGKSVYIDRAAFCQMTRAYRGGWFVSVFSGNVNMVRGDTIWLNISNNYAGGFQQLFNKLFSMSQINNSNNTGNIILPSSLSPTISDSLIS